MTDNGRPAIPIDPLRVKRILVCQLRQLGDVLLTTPSCRLLAEAFPSAAIHFFTEKKCAPLLEHNPSIHNIWVVDKGQQSNLLKEVCFYWKVARQGYDLVIDFQQLPRCRWVVAFSRATVRLSYTPPWYNRWLYTHTIDPLGGYSAMSKASLLRLLGITWQGEPPEFHLTGAERDWAEAYLRTLGLESDEFFITVDATHRRVTRRWPAEHFAAFVRLAAQRYPAVKFLLLYGPGEKEVIEQVARASTRPDRCLIPPELLSLRQMGACLERAAVHVGTCSAPRHMAVAVGTPSLAVLGATSGSWTFPSPSHRDISAGLDCQPCNQNDCPHCRCLSTLTADRVLRELDALIVSLKVFSSHR